MRVDFQLNPLQKAILYDGFYVLSFVTAANFDIHDPNIVQQRECLTLQKENNPEQEINSNETHFLLLVIQISFTRKNVLQFICK